MNKKNEVSMGCSLGSTMTNNVMNKLEKKTIKPPMNDGKTKFYCWYVDGALLNMKPQDVSLIHNLLNSFDKTLQFTIDLFENEVPHFFD